MAEESEKMDTEIMLPESELRLMEYAEARAKELYAMDKASSTINKIVPVPNHMRRRAAGHNFKRLPRRLQHKAKMKEVDQPKKTKCPSRYHRRRPKNLLQEYNRRKRKNMWLETHIWHAKRFHMSESWGYKIPNFPNDKSLRTCYRASNEACIMWDLSYLCCIEVIGRQKEILEGLQMITSPDIGIPFSSSSCINGSIEGSTFIYSSNKYPNGAIGPVCYTWKPIVKLNADIAAEDQTYQNRSIWLWTHPSTYEQIIKELQNVFQANQVIANTKESLVAAVKDNELTETAKQLSAKCNGIKSDGKNSDRLNVKVPNVDVSFYSSPMVRIKPLKDNLCRYRLIGPNAHAIITDLLRVANINPSLTEKGDIEENSSGQYWWQNFYNTCESTIKLHHCQGLIWDKMKKMQYAAYMPPRTVLGLTVKDPRLALPPKKHVIRAKEEKDSTTHKTHNDQDAEIDYWPRVSYSALWEDDIRRNVKETMLSEQEINRKRSDILLPGVEIDLGNEESRIPIMLIQKPGNLTSCPPSIITSPNEVKMGLENSNSGWDLILPAGWGMAFWIALVYRGARVGGMRELKDNQLENGQFYFPNYHPDTIAGKEMQCVTKKSLEDVYFKKPPAKRPNYDKLGIPEPFHCPWDKIASNSADEKKVENLTETNGDQIKDEKNGAQLFVLRTKDQVQLFLNLQLKNEERVETKTAASGDLCTATYHLGSPSCIVPIQLNMVLRGTCQAFSHICKPSQTDHDNFKANANYAGPLEPLHKMIAKSGLIETNVPSLLQENKAENKNNSACSRHIIGYVTQGGFSLKLGKGAGLGYVSHHAVNKLIKEQGSSNPLVLIRGPTCFQYRYALLTLVKSDQLCIL